MPPPMAAFLPPLPLGALAVGAGSPPRLSRASPLPPPPPRRSATTTVTAAATTPAPPPAASVADGAAAAAAAAAAAPRSRRAVLVAAAAVAAAAAAATAAAPATAAVAAAAAAPAAATAAAAAAAEEDRRPPFVTLPSGVRVQEITVGEGKVVTDGSVVSLQYVLRRPNGYFVDASYGFDRMDLYTYTAGGGGVVAGFDDAVRGMAPGGRRRFVVPPRAGYVGGVGGGKPGPIPPGWGERRALASHVGEDLVFEVRVVRVK